ncbi:MAG: IclR family transcriptional regulator [Anaerolineales bacterium]
MQETHGRYNIRVLERAIALLSLLSDGQTKRLPELAKSIELSESSTYRLLSTLTSHDYVAHDKRRGGYRLGLACLELARAYQAGSDMRQVALPELEALRDETSETVHLGLLADMEVVYLEKLPGLHAIGIMSSQVGGRSPSYCTGLGKALLAYLDPETVRSHFDVRRLHRFTPNTITNLGELIRHLSRIQQQGYALDMEEHEPEVRCVAAPVFDPNGEVVAAVSVSGPAGRIKSLMDEQDLVGRTVRASQGISRDLGYIEARAAGVSRKEATLG